MILSVWVNSVDPDQIPQNVGSNLGLYFLPLIRNLSDTSTGNTRILPKAMSPLWRSEVYANLQSVNHEIESRGQI